MTFRPMGTARSARPLLLHGLSPDHGGQLGRSDRIASSTIVETYGDGSKRVAQILPAVGGTGRNPSEEA